MNAQNPTWQTEIRPYGTAAIAEAAEWIGRGQPVAIATETVYGLAGDATSDSAVARIYAAKGRPSFNPLIVHLPSAEAAAEVADFPPAARLLAKAFWPGPLTMVLPLLPGAKIAPIVTAGLPTVAIRVPAHPAMQALLAEVGRPLAAPSANASGSISPTTAQHVLASLDGRIPMVIDSGPTRQGIESTIVAIDTDGGARLLRPGPITPDQIAAVTGQAVYPAGSGKIEAPGQLASHYAPSRPLRLDAVDRRDGEWLIGFGPVAGDATLSDRGDLVEAAARLFAALHEADLSDCAGIAVAPIPADGLGLAINDRLRRAAAPKS
ncbi:MULTISPECIES: L-threonylcarbamoyladenylate synthase [Sphingomonas]|uniref:Threonylcarbamoyl-AMP synthase n=1 Tax=Edaphosphingomonas fennica TaxID=114404 RepID=A0A2T4HJ60_9SPHN|nr:MULTISPECIES: L-threonylcarbamoyladenylate synthase [Sphingomonas]AGH47969.1 translation factor SUA5 [Sphingomonas sp. MM-1]PTD15816.1 threonylcarbamoyl-AMP synthase [Sphingomonas fennica]